MIPHETELLLRAFEAMKNNIAMTMGHDWWDDEALFNEIAVWLGREERFVNVATGKTDEELAEPVEPGNAATVADFAAALKDTFDPRIIERATPPRPTLARQKINITILDE